MSFRRAGLWLCGGLVWLTGCSILRPQNRETIPVLFSTPPSLEQVIQAVNANSAPVRQLHAEGATLSVPGTITLRANLVMERPRRFRLTGSALGGLSGTEIDLGSNDELLWMWVKRAQPPALYYARHDQFHLSPAKQILPIEPPWLIEALGVAYFDPNARHDGPFETGDGRLEIRSRVYSPQGEMNRITFVDGRYGYVVEQRVHDPSGRLVAVARESQHRHYPQLRVTLPHRVDVELPPAQMAFTLDVPRYAINQINGDAVSIFAMPQIEGYPLIDLADPRNFGIPPPDYAASSQQVYSTHEPLPATAPYGDYTPRW